MTFGLVLCHSVLDEIGVESTTYDVTPFRVGTICSFCFKKINIELEFVASKVVTISHIGKK